MLAKKDIGKKPDAPHKKEKIGDLLYKHAKSCIGKSKLPKMTAQKKEKLNFLDFAGKKG